MAIEEGWSAFEMRSDGTTVFYSKTTGREKSDDPESYLHIYEPHKKEKQGLIRLHPTDRVKHVGNFSIELEACFNYLGGSGTTRQRCKTSRPTRVEVVDLCDTATV